MKRICPQAFLLVAVLPMFASCAHAPRYAEPTLPLNELAQLECAAPIWIVSVDGKGSSSSSVFSDLNRLRISPGAHRVEVSYRRTNIHNAPPPQENGAVYNAGDVSAAMHENAQVNTYSLRNVTLNFIAKPQFTYFVKDGLIGTNWNPRIVESAGQ